MNFIHFLLRNHTRARFRHASNAFVLKMDHLMLRLDLIHFLRSPRHFILLGANRRLTLLELCLHLRHLQHGHELALTHMRAKVH